MRNVTRVDVSVFFAKILMQLLPHFVRSVILLTDVLWRCRGEILATIFVVEYIALSVSACLNWQ